MPLRTSKNNIYKIPAKLPGKEVFDILFKSRNVKVERIISSGQSTPKGRWLVQKKDEFVILLGGRAVVGFEKGKINLKKGDYLLIPAGMKHRVESTSRNPICIWLAFHFSPEVKSRSGFTK